MTSFIERLQEAARRAGFGTRQSDIARSLKASRQTVNQWFHGTEPNATTAFQIAQRYGVSATWLMTGSGDMHPRPEGEDLSSEEIDLIWHYRKISPQLRHAINAMVRALAKDAATARASRRLNKNVKSEPATNS